MTYFESVGQRREASGLVVQQAVDSAVEYIDIWLHQLQMALKTASVIEECLQAANCSDAQIAKAGELQLAKLLRAENVHGIAIIVYDADWKAVLGLTTPRPLRDAIGAKLKRRREPINNSLYPVLQQMTAKEGDLTIFSVGLADQSELIGTVAFAFRSTVIIDLLQRAFRNLQIGGTIRGFLDLEGGGALAELRTDADGEMLWSDCSEDDGIPSAESKCNQSNFASLTATDSSTVSASSAYSPLRLTLSYQSNSDWYLFTKGFWLWVIITLPVFWLLMIAVHAAVDKIISPINLLKEQMKSLLSGSRSFARQSLAASSETDEVQSLSAAFSELSERLDETLSELRGARDQAEAANRMKSEFLAHVSHEIRTPLTAILGFAEMIQREMGDYQKEKGYQSHVDAIARNGRHLLAIINDILDLSKIEAGELRLQESWLAPGKVIEEILAIMEPAAKGKGLRLSWGSGQDLGCEVWSDILRFRQVLLNLTDNAIKFTRNGEVTIHLSAVTIDEETLKLMVQVCDTGVGISPSQKSKLFVPFSQLGRATNSGVGTGLGLAISQKLAQVMGGEISCESQIGVGSQFTWTLKVKYRRQVIAAEVRNISAAALHLPESMNPSRSRRKSRILVAEDTPDNKMLIRFMLEKIGVQSEIVDNGQLALEAVSKHEDLDYFDLILMDIEMPILNGYDATQRLRALGYQNPIVALTAHAMAGDRQRCIDVGCNSYLTKPIRLEELSTELKTQLGG